MTCHIVVVYKQHYPTDLCILCISLCPPHPAAHIPMSRHFFVTLAFPDLDCNHRNRSYYGKKESKQLIQQTDSRFHCFDNTCTLRYIEVVKKRCDIQPFFSTTVHAFMPQFRNTEHYYEQRYKFGNRVNKHEINIGLTFYRSRKGEKNESQKLGVPCPRSCYFRRLFSPFVR